MTIECSMDFQNYPFDAQKCLLLFGSASKDVEQMVFDGTISHHTIQQRTLQYTVSHP